MTLRWLAVWLCVKEIDLHIQHANFKNCGGEYSGIKYPDKSIPEILSGSLHVFFFFFLDCFYSISSMMWFLAAVLRWLLRMLYSTMTVNHLALPLSVYFVLKCSFNIRISNVKGILNDSAFINTTLCCSNFVLLSFFSGTQKLFFIQWKWIGLVSV